ncbi:MAG: ABC transporter ATP-binding protein [Acidimicrobiia bacterium]|nr:ABC transporter ATP-binding protein [Acidimicrobiia bacterium]MDH3396965.1 ABC transporter ATP-binding protein [Acidimicrobiia bacterium]
MVSVTLAGLSKAYESTEVLKGLDLHVEDGELLALLGPSGCGKSTILRLVAGLEAPTEGRILFDGEDVTEVPTRDRHVAMVQQDGTLYSHLTAQENIRFPLAVRKVPKPEGDREIEAGATHLGIRALLGKMPAELSAGHRHSVATARALIQESRVLLMDEPLASLDAKIRERTRLEIVRLHRELGSTMMYVTNDEREAMALGNRLAVFDEVGNLRQVGPPQEIYNRPRSLFVAEFLGYMNHATVRLERDDEGWWLPIGNDRLLLDSAIAARPGLDRYQGKELVVGIRPEHIVVATPGTRFALCLHGTVGRVEDAGSFANAWVTVGTLGLKARLPADRLPVRGNLIELTVDPLHFHFFDADTAEAI